MKNLYLRLVARIASFTNFVVFSTLWLLTEFLVRPGAELEISRWSQGKEALYLPLIIHPQKVLEQIIRYGDEGRRVYLFVVLTVEMVSALLCFISFSALLYLLAGPTRRWWQDQWWKITLLMGITDIMVNSLLLQLLSGDTKADNFLAWGLVILNGASHLIHGLVWLMVAILLWLNTKKSFTKHFRKTW